MKETPLAGVFSFLLPDMVEAALLRVCLVPDRSRQAWSEWSRLGGDLDHHRALLPLVGEGARKGGVELDAGVAALLASARLHESLRLNAIRDITREVLDYLANRRFDPVVIRDVALAETVYGDPALRHCHALEILLPAGAVAEAERLLERDVDRRGGFPVRLVAAPLPRFPGAEASTVFARTTVAEIAGGTVRVPGPEVALALVLAGAATGAERRSLFWACDAAHTVDAVPELDWSAVAKMAVEWGLGMPLAAQLEWLAGDIDVRVPADAIRLMAARPSRGASRGRAIEVALDCVRADGRAGPRALLARSADWRERVRILRWTLAPSPGRLRRSFPNVPRAALPLLYLARPLLYVARSARRTFSSSRPDGARAFRGRGGETVAAHSGDP